MSTRTQLSANDLFRLGDRLGRCELVAGKVTKMAPAGWRHGKVVGRLHGLLARHVSDNDLGLLFGAETGFLLERDPDTVRAPDIAFIAKRDAEAPEPQEAFWPGAPDLAVEVLSPDDSRSYVDAKVKAWFKAGARLVWVADPEKRCVRVFSSESDVTVQTLDDALSGAEVVPGFRCAVREVFA